MSRRVGGALPERADEGRKTWASSSIPWQLLGVAGGMKAFWFFELLNRSRAWVDGWPLAAQKRGTSTCRLIRWLKDYLRSMPPLLSHSSRERPTPFYCKNDWILLGTFLSGSMILATHATQIHLVRSDVLLWNRG